MKDRDKTRREMLTKAAHIAGAWLLGACASNSTQPQPAACGDPVTPPAPDGPYYQPGQSTRVDIREDRDGIPLELRFTVKDGSCKPVAGATVDIWHCDKDGLYSEVASQGTADETWLRGQGLTDEDGECHFKTIFPGWYDGRLTHIHVKVHVDGTTKQTTNLFLPKDVQSAAYSDERYTKGQNPTTVEEDLELQGDDVRYSALIMDVTGDATTGFVATYTVAYV
jgi:protocatechuate 3,4-dioxygenase beta subunit